MIIEVKNLSFSYYENHPALDGVDIMVDCGERVALVGPNGAGKTTLLQHLNGILRGEGEIWIDGDLLKDETLPVIRGKVGFLFQSPDDQLFSSTVYNDAAYGPIHQGLEAEAVERRVSDALSMVGMDASRDAAPYHLSLGEKRRAALATVLSMQPEILALDEPTSGLDPRGKRELIRLMKRMPQTIIAATHDLSLIPDLFPRMVIMEKGKIVYDGDSIEALHNRDLLANHGLA